MRWFRYAFFILIITVIQASLLERAAVTQWRIKPDLLLILLVFFAVYCDNRLAVITSFTLGFAADLIGSSMGPQIISFGIFGTLLAYLNQVVAIRHKFYQSMTIFITGIICGTLTYYLNLIKGQPSTDHVFIIIAGTAAYSAAVGPFFFLPSAWWMRINTQVYSKG